jgi:hypothetical protein
MAHVAQANSSGGRLVDCLCKRAQGSQTAESSPAKTMHSADLAERLADGWKRPCSVLGMGG